MSAKLNCRWRKGAVRHSGARTVEHARWLRIRGAWRYMIDNPSEIVYCARLRESFGWFRGARVRYSTQNT